MSEAPAAALPEPEAPPILKVLAAPDVCEGGWRGFVGLGSEIVWAATRTHGTWQAARRYAKDRALRIGFY